MSGKRRCQSDSSDWVRSRWGTVEGMDRQPDDQDQDRTEPDALDEEAAQIDPRSEEAAEQVEELLEDAAKHSRVPDHEVTTDPDATT